MPLTRRALATLDTIQRRLDTPLVFPATGGGFLDINNFRRREWSPLSRFMGCGVRVIDRTYGHLVLGSEARAREKLEFRALREAETVAAENVRRLW